MSTVLVNIEHATKGRITITAWTTETPGLVIHLSVGDPAWVVTHQRSGLLIGMVDTRDEAREFAARLGTAGDWTRSGREIRADAAMVRKAVEIVRARSLAYQPQRDPHRNAIAEAR